MISLGGTNHLGDAIWDDSVPKYVVVLPRTLTSTEDRGYWGGRTRHSALFLCPGRGHTSHNVSLPMRWRWTIHHWLIRKA